MTALMAATIAALEKPRLDETQIVPASNRDFARDVKARVDRKRSREAMADETERRIAVIRDGILKMNDPMYGENCISFALADERARNILTALDLQP